MSKPRFINPLLQRTEEPEPPRTPAPAAAPAPAPPPAPEPAGGAPVKFTFYFQPDQLRRLDDLWLRAKLQYRAKINKSEFVRLALDRLIDEFDRDPERVLQDLSRHRS